MKVQGESDKQLIWLNEKHLEFEERQVEKETQQRREEREFQLKMMQLMMGQGYGQAQPHYHPQGPFEGMQEGAIADHDPMYTFPPPPENASNNNTYIQSWRLACNNRINIISKPT